MSTAKKRGWSRWNELRQQDAADQQAIIDGLIADLGRPPSMNDRLAIEDIASCTIEARRLERRGKYAEAVKVRDQINRTRRANGIRPQPPAPAPKKSLAEQLREKQTRPDTTMEAAR